MSTGAKIGIGLAVVVVVVLFLAMRGGGNAQASTGSITQLGPTANDASIQTSRLSAAAQAFTALTNSQAATQQTALTTAANVNIAQITAPAYEQAAAAQAAAAEAIAAITTQPSLVNAQTQQQGQQLGFIGKIGQFIASLFGLGGSQQIAAPTGQIGGGGGVQLPTGSYVSPPIYQPGTSYSPGTVLV